MSGGEGGAGPTGPTGPVPWRGGGAGGGGAAPLGSGSPIVHVLPAPVTVAVQEAHRSPLVGVLAVLGFLMAGAALIVSGHADGDVRYLRNSIPTSTSATTAHTPSTTVTPTTVATSCAWDAATCRVLAVDHTHLQASCGAGYVLDITFNADGTLADRSHCIPKEQP